MRIGLRNLCRYSQNLMRIFFVYILFAAWSPAVKADSACAYTLSTILYGAHSFTFGQTPTVPLNAVFSANANSGTVACTPGSSSVVFTARILPTGNLLGQVTVYLQAQTNVLRYTMSGQQNFTLPQLPVGGYTIALEGFSGPVFQNFQKFSITAPPTPKSLAAALVPILDIILSD